MNPQPEMNAPDPELTVLESSQAAAAGEGDAIASLPAPTLPVAASTGPTHRPRSKISKLRKVLRDLINSMLDEGHPYAEIIEKLQQAKDRPLPYPISEMNISRWKDTGYQDYLALQERLAAVQANREAGADILTAADTTTLPEANLQVIASHYYDILGDFPTAALKRKLADDPLKYARFLSIFARLSREILTLKMHREASAKAVAAELKRLDPNREFSDREDEILTQRMDDFFKKPPRKRPAPEQPNPSQPPPADH